MIHLLNINDSSNAALVRMCKERGVSPNVLLSNIVTESIRALVSERALSIDNILNPVGLAADLIRSTMNEAEFAEFCETDVTIDDMEDNFQNNCSDLVENPSPEADLARRFIASLFLGEVNLALFSGGTTPAKATAKSENWEATIPAYVQSLVDVLKACRGQAMKFKEIAELCEDVPNQAAPVFSKLVSTGQIPGVTVSKDSNKTNVYVYSEQ